VHSAVKLILVLCAIVGASQTRAAGPDSVDPADRSAALSVVGRRLALIVGTTNYQNPSWPRLPNATSDARALADELERRYGFEVTFLDGPDVSIFKTELRRLSEVATPADDLLVFVAGHGHFDEVDNAGYLVLGGADATCERGCYAFDNLKRALFGSRARHALVMLDVCYGGTFDLRVAMGGGAPDRSRSDPESLRRLLKDYAQYPSRQVFASVGRATTTDGPAGSHSPFMSTLLMTLSRPGNNGVVSLDRIFLAVQDARPGTPLQRPTSFEAATAHHPNGTFLFIEDVDFCEATSRIVRDAPERFVGLQSDIVQATDWATTWTSTWVIPGTSQCRIWHWGDGKAQLRCEFGRFEKGGADFRAAALFQRVRECFAADGSRGSEPVLGLQAWLPSEHQRRHGQVLHHDLVLTRREGEAALQTGSVVRKVTVTRTCDGECGVSLVFE
jgi:hypothetical protein